MQDLEVVGDEYIVPSSLLNQLRRKAVEALDEAWMESYDERRRAFVKPDYAALAQMVDASCVLPTDFKANVLNAKAREMFRLMGVENVEQAFESQSNNRKGETLVMQTRHCLKYALGQCPKERGKKGGNGELSTISLQEPLTLKIGNEKFILKFGCKNACISEIFRIFAPD